MKTKSKTHSSTADKKDEIKPAELTNAVKDAAKDLKHYEELVKSASPHPQKGGRLGQSGGGMMDTFKGPMMTAKIIIIMGILIASYAKYNNKYAKVNMVTDENAQSVKLQIRSKTNYDIPVDVINSLLQNVNSIMIKSAASIGNLSTVAYNLVRRVPNFLLSKKENDVKTEIKKESPKAYELFKMIKDTLPMKDRKLRDYSI